MIESEVRGFFGGEKILRLRNGCSQLEEFEDKDQDQRSERDLIAASFYSPSTHVRRLGGSSGVVL